MASCGDDDNDGDDDNKRALTLASMLVEWLVVVVVVVVMGVVVWLAGVLVDQEERTVPTPRTVRDAWRRARGCGETKEGRST